MKRLLLVRHGETAWNAARSLQGQTDIPLSDRGRAQALALAPLIAGLQPDHWFSSDLSRAAETALLIGGGNVQHTTLLREQLLGQWQGMAIEDLLAHQPENYHGWRAGRYTPVGAEDWPTFGHRIQTALNTVLARCDKVAVVVCHGGAIRAALDQLIGLSPAHIVPVGPASLTILAHDGRCWRLEAMNIAGGAPVLDAPD